MRVKFSPIKPLSVCEIMNELSSLNFLNLLFYKLPNPDDTPIIKYAQSYTDDCRYDLHIIQGFLPYINENKIHQGSFCFIEIKTKFDFPFNFMLFNASFSNYWGRDTDINIIKPSIFVSGSNERTLAIAAFRSLASSYFARITETIGFDKNNLVIFKNGNAFVIGFNLNKKTAKSIDFVIENFVDAVYEMVKATYGYGFYQLPDINYKVQVNMAQQYSAMRKKNNRNKPGILVEKNY